MQAALAGDVFGILDVTEEDQVAQAVHFGVGAENVDGYVDSSERKCGADVGEHFFQDGCHLGEIAGVFRVEASAGGLAHCWRS